MRGSVDVEEAGPCGQGQMVTFEADPGEDRPSAGPQVSPCGVETEWPT